MKVDIATSIKYGNYKALQVCANQIHRFILVNYAALANRFPSIKDTFVRIRPIKGSKVGWARSKSKVAGMKYEIEIDPREGFKKCIDTLGHELQHTLQYETGRLLGCRNQNAMEAMKGVHESPNAINRSRVWEGKFFYVGCSFKDYLNSPWEVEARAAGKELTDKFEL